MKYRIEWTNWAWNLFKGFMIGLGTCIAQILGIMGMDKVSPNFKFPGWSVVGLIALFNILSHIAVAIQEKPIPDRTPEP